MWRAKLEGFRADHMAIAPDGRRLLVSASTARKVQVIDTSNGAIVSEFASGDQPHENNFSADGKLIYHASIGMVYTPGDAPELDALKGDRYFQVVDARTLQILGRIELGKVLAAARLPRLQLGRAPDGARRPTGGSRTCSCRSCTASSSLTCSAACRCGSRSCRSARRRGRCRARPIRWTRRTTASRSNPAGTKLCVAGTVSDYAAIVDRDDFSATLLDVGRRPYWATNSADGRYCFVSASGDDRVAVISYADERVVATIGVGDHPQRMRTGVMRADYLPPVADRAGPRITGARVVRGVLRLTLSEAARVRAVVQRARGGRWRTVRVVQRSAGAGSLRVRLGALRAAGRHRVSLTATDDAGNRSPRRLVRFAVAPSRRG